MATMTGCGPATRDLIARLTTPSRNRYYYGKLLDAYHLELEQTYGNAKRWMLNRLSLGAGVLCGIGVNVSADRMRVRVTAGVAIDYFGREIIVPQDSPAFDPTQPTDDCGRPAGDPIRGRTVTLYLCYHECETEPSPALVDECCDDPCENGLIRERYRLQARAGTPAPPGLVSGAECVRIFGQPPANVTRRTVVCQTLSGACAAPDESCISIATLQIDDHGAVTSVDTCTFRPNVYSNAVLLDLILCLAERVDECCGGKVGVEAIEIVSGNNQAGPAGQSLPKPLVARVTQGGNPVANEPVTFDVTDGGGAIGATLATLGPSFTVNTDASGDATLPIWRLGPTPGSQQHVTARIASGAFVTFSAKAERVPAVNPPVIRAIWPPNGAQLGPNASNIEQRWFREFREAPQLQITFDRKMRQSQLNAPDPWLRLVAIISSRPEVNAPSFAVRIPLTYEGTENAPILGVAGVTEQYRIEVPRIVAATTARYLVQIRAEADNIVDAAVPPLMLDADFAGTRLAPAQLDALWALNGNAPADAATVAALVSGAATLPQSGDGTPGGRFHSWFEVFA